MILSNSGQAKSLSGSRKHAVDSGLSFESIRHHLDSNHSAFVDASLNTSRLLEIGCGYGRMTTLIANYYAHFEVVGFDVSPKFIQIAKDQEKQQLSILNKRKAVEYYVADAGDKIDEKFLNFDISLSINVLQNCCSRESVLQAFCQSHYDSLRPGGLCLLVFGPSDPEFFQRQLVSRRECGRNGFRCIGKSYGFRESDDAVYEGIPYQSLFANADAINRLWDNYFWSAQKVEEALVKAGFVNIKHVPHLLVKDWVEPDEDDITLAKTFIECHRPL